MTVGRQTYARVQIIMTVERSCEIILNDGAIDLYEYDNKTEYSSGSLMSNVSITDIGADNTYLKTCISSKPTPTHCQVYKS